METETKTDIHPLISERWSPRTFSDKMITDEELNQLLEAARWAPSSFNEQPWRFIVAKKDEPKHFENLFNCLKEGNQNWAKNAPVLMMTVAKKNFSKNDKPNKHHFHDVGLAMGNLMIQAMDLDIYIHQMAGYYPDKARENLNIPEDYEPVAAVALGKLPEDFDESDKKESKRKALSELAFSGEFGNKLYKGE